MKIPKIAFVLLLFLFVFHAQAANECFSPISKPDLNSMWMSEEGFRLAAGQTHMDFGEARFYHDGEKIYVYIRNDQNYASGANIKFDISNNLAELGSKSNELNNQQIPVSSSIPPGTVLWFASSFACWDLPNQN